MNDDYKDQLDYERQRANVAEQQNRELIEEAQPAFVARAEDGRELYAGTESRAINAARNHRRQTGEDVAVDGSKWNSRKNGWAYDRIDQKWVRW